MNVINFLSGKKTYLVGLLMIGLYIAQNYCGVSITGLDANINMLLEGVAILTGRAAIAKAMDKK